VLEWNEENVSCRLDGFDTKLPTRLFDMQLRRGAVLTLVIQIAPVYPGTDLLVAFREHLNSPFNTSSPIDLDQQRPMDSRQGNHIKSPSAENIAAPLRQQ
jgi:hypothetical protein